ncbi:hypothetical protein ABW20_dc0107789 [Dactylellina cionopaga]|nr:hypothetical protein ABW20_dc0107789 [Dactylellina cionopaga]
MALHDNRYHVHQLLREYYFFVHSPSKTPRDDGGTFETKSMTVTLIPITSMSPSMAEMYPSKISFLGQNLLLEFQDIKSIPGAVTFTDAPFFDDPVWINVLNPPPFYSAHPDCTVSLYSASCIHPSTTLTTPAQHFTMREMLSKAISYAGVTAKIFSTGCDKCEEHRKAWFRQAKTYTKPIYLQDDYVEQWTFRKKGAPWLGTYSQEKYFVNVQDLEGQRIGVEGKLVKAWHWMLFWESIKYANDRYTPADERHGCVVLGIDEL